MSKPCVEKVCYPSRGRALRARRRILARGKADYLRAYPCSHCDGWHLTSRPLR